MAGGKFSEALLYGMTLRESLDDGSDFGNPTADYRVLYLGEDGGLHLKDSAGAVTDVVAEGGYVSGEMAYVEFTSPVTISATTEATADQIVSAGSVSFDGSTAVIIEFFTPECVNPNATDNARFAVYDGSSSLGELARTLTAAVGSGLGFPVYLRYRLTPSNASHTYSIRGWKGTNNWSAQAGAGGAGAFMPGFIRISKA